MVVFAAAPNIRAAARVTLKFSREGGAEAGDVVVALPGVAEEPAVAVRSAYDVAEIFFVIGRGLVGIELRGRRGQAERMDGRPLRRAGGSAAQNVPAVL
jgi:hypothetical protein